ncbi:MAG TPA: hypothetical protein VFW53_01765 [Gallionella sp.]|nr:hypothetical protein [Gallionella sp.]
MKLSTAVRRQRRRNQIRYAKKLSLPAHRIDRDEPHVAVPPP